MALINNIIQIEEFTLVAGNTDIVYSVSGTLPNALIGLYCDVYGVYPVEVTKENNSIHIKYDAQATDIHVALIFFKGEFNIVNNLTSTSETDALSAAQGKILKDLIDAIGDPALSDLTDIDISEVSTDDILIYDGVSEKWINTPFPSIPSDIDDLQDVVITSPTNNDVLTYDNGDWVNKPAQGGSSGNINYDNVIYSESYTTPSAPYDYDYTATQNCYCYFSIVAGANQDTYAQIMDGNTFITYVAAIYTSVLCQQTYGCFISAGKKLRIHSTFRNAQLSIKVFGLT